MTIENKLLPFWNGDNIFSATNNVSLFRPVPVATTLHPRWDESGDVTIYGTDRFGFGALPSGLRAGDGTYLQVGEYFVNKYYFIQFDGSGATAIEGGINEGLSVRAVRAATIEEQILPDGLISATATFDGDVYQCTKIGLQVWTTTNLKVTHYADGTLIPTNLSDAAWGADTAGACAVYGKKDGAFVPTDELDTEAKMVAAYGRLYNWYAVNNAHGLIDTTNGWHVPTDAEFAQLTDYLIATYSDITIDNVGDVLKSVRQVNSPYSKTTDVVYPKYAKNLLSGMERYFAGQQGAYTEEYTEQYMIPFSGYYIETRKVCTDHVFFSWIDDNGFWRSWYFLLAETKNSSKGVTVDLVKNISASFNERVNKIDQKKTTISKIFTSGNEPKEVLEILNSIKSSSYVFMGSDRVNVKIEDTTDFKDIDEFIFTVINETKTAI